MGYPIKFASIIRHKHAAHSKCLRGYQYIVRTDSQAE